MDYLQSLQRDKKYYEKEAEEFGKWLGYSIILNVVLVVTLIAITCLS
jgi:hypothetical protein